jgi:hypothetical protein
MPKAPSPEKQQVEIVEEPKTPREVAAAELLKRLEKPVQPPPIEDTLEKANQAIAQAKKARTREKMTWYCTDCGGPHIQNDNMGLGLGHINVDVDDGKFVDDSGQPLTGSPLRLMQEYAAPKAQSGQGHKAGTNAQTLSKMKQ